MRLEELKKRQKPRHLLADKFLEALKDKPTGKVEILCQPDDPEAYGLGLELFMTLGNTRWQASFPRQISPDDASSVVRNADSKLLQMLPPTARVSGQPFGVSILANDMSGLNDSSHEKVTALRALYDALSASEIRAWSGRDKNLSTDTIRIVIGPRR